MLIGLVGFGVGEGVGVGVALGVGLADGDCEPVGFAPTDATEQPVSASAALTTTATPRRRITTPHLYWHPDGRRRTAPNAASHLPEMLLVLSPFSVPDAGPFGLVTTATNW